MEAGVGGRFLCGDWRRRIRPGRALQSLASFQPALAGSSPARPPPALPAAPQPSLRFAISGFVWRLAAPASAAAELRLGSSARRTPKVPLARAPIHTLAAAAAATTTTTTTTTTTPLPSFLPSASAARVPPAPAPPPSCPPRSPPGQAVGGSGAGEAGGLALAPRGSVCALRGRTRSLPRFSRPPLPLLLLSPSSSPLRRRRLRRRRGVCELRPGPAGGRRAGCLQAEGAVLCAFRREEQQAAATAAAATAAAAAAAPAPPPPRPEEEPLPPREGAAAVPGRAGEGAAAQSRGGSRRSGKSGGRAAPGNRGG
ncbi:hypothetical protein J1605_003837 [Eschrichtius robustus]|uniref:Uncharacterized protein n=1 Tax=Eschrichtius robustus TaxID=9764 RepID=A0AB34HQN2_ESCRO|nr:hypothetical protein J1605_003837 [Eschrichtius robustus]